MGAFGDDEFCRKILSLYAKGRENNYFLKLDEDEVNELKDIYIRLYIPPDNVDHYDDTQMIKKLMVAVVSVHNLEKDVMMRTTGEMLQLVNSVNYDGRNMYLNLAKISCVKLRRLMLGKTQKDVAEHMGYSISTVRNCEKYTCDLTRQPETLVSSLAVALECEAEDLYNDTLIM